MVVTLEEVKQYLRVDADADDALITTFIHAAEELCEDILRFSLVEFVEIPEVVRQSIFYAVANFYEQRESVDIKAVIEVMKRLLFAYRREGY